MELNRLLSRFLMTLPAEVRVIVADVACDVAAESTLVIYVGRAMLITLRLAKA